MKTTILLGWAKTDASGNPLGAARVISGPPEDDAATREQAALFHEAKQLHKFPKGIRYLAFGNVEITSAAAFISADVTEQIQGREQQRLVNLEEQIKKAEAAKTRQTAVAEAHAALRRAAVDHNTATAALQTGKNRLLDAEANFKQTKTDSHKAELDNAKLKVEELTKAEAAAKETLIAAKKAHAEALNTTP